MIHTISQLIDHFMANISIDQIKTNTELQFLWERLIEKRGTYGPNHTLIAQGYFREMLIKYFPELFANNHATVKS